MLVDPKVYDLAKAFLDDVKMPKGSHPISPMDVQELAESIQQAIEDFIEGLKED